MNAEIVLAAACVLNPRSIERARRLALAVHLIGQGLSRKDAAALLRARSGCGQPEAWRMVDMAADMAEGRVVTVETA